MLIDIGLANKRVNVPMMPLFTKKFHGFHYFFIAAVITFLNQLTLNGHDNQINNNNDPIVH